MHLPSFACKPHQTTSNALLCADGCSRSPSCGRCCPPGSGRHHRRGTGRGRGVPLRPDEVLTRPRRGLRRPGWRWGVGVCSGVGSVPGAGRSRAHGSPAVTPTLVRRTAGAFLGVGAGGGPRPGGAVPRPQRRRVMRQAPRCPTPAGPRPCAPRRGPRRRTCARAWHRRLGRPTRRPHRPGRPAHRPRRPRRRDPVRRAGTSSAPVRHPRAGPAEPRANAAIATRLGAQPSARASPAGRAGAGPAPPPGTDGDEPVRRRRGRHAVGDRRPAPRARRLRRRDRARLAGSGSRPTATWSATTPTRCARSGAASPHKAAP